MKRSLLLLGLAAWGVGLPFSLYAEDEPSSCKTLFVRFVEGWTPQETAAAPGVMPPAKSVSGRDITGVFTCHGGNFQFPTMTVLHFIEEKPDGRICYHDRSCGNVDSWDVSVGLSFSFWNFTSRLTDYSITGDWLNYRGHSATETRGTSISLDVGVRWGHIDRYCRALSEEVCL